MKAKWQRKDKNPVMPKVVLIASPQNNETMQIPTWVKWIKDIDDVPRRLFVNKET